MEVQEVLDILENQEKVFALNSLSNWDLLEIGYGLAKEVKDGSQPVAIQIYKGDIPVFSWTMEGKELSHYGWIKKKLNLARKVNQSSFQAKIRQHYLKDRNELYNDLQYAFGAGAFPIRNENGKVLAWIGISGLAEPADHFLIVSFLEKWMHKKAEHLPNIFEQSELPAIETLKEIPYEKN